MNATLLSPPACLEANRPWNESGPMGCAIWLASLLFLASLTTASSQPVITRPPTGQSLSLGATATFRVSATGTAPLAYQWRFNDLDLAGATDSRLVLTDVQLTAAGEYTVVVKNIEGAVTSQAAILDVDPTFTKITSDPIVTDKGYEWHAQAWGDYDGDGDQDVLIITDRTGWDPIYRNNGAGTFTRTFDPSLQAALDSGFFRLNVCYSWGDYDNDGFLDLFVADYGALMGQPGKNLLFHNSGNGTLTRVTNSPIATEGAISSYGTWGDFNRDGNLDLFVANGGAAEILSKNWFYQNQGDGSFLKLTNALVSPLISELGHFMIPAWVDVDDDGWQDLFVLHWPGPGANRLYRNLGGGGFVKVTGDPLVSETNYWGNVAWADYDNDGDLDVFLTTGGRFNPTGPVALYRNNGTGQFSKMNANDVGPLVNEQVNSFACAWGDYDNDGWIDLYVANGWKDGGTRPDLHYRNNGDGAFTKITTGSPATEKGAGSTANWVDVNNDGFLDLFTTKFSAPDNSLNRLYIHNGNSNNWLGVKCIGTVSPRWGTGAKVRVQATIRGTPMWQLRLIDAGGSSWGSQSFVAHFGLGDATVVDTLRIVWSSGIVQELKNVAVNQYLTVTERPKFQTEWVRIPTDPASTPPGRESAAMVYDEKREVILMHGGRDASRTFSDTWEWDGKSWTLVSTNGPGVLLHSMAYDAFRGVTVLYGGRWAAGRETNYLNANETWECDGESWKRIDTGAAAPLVLAGLAYDSQRKKVLRHGGIFNGDVTYEDPATYEWDGTNWTAIAQGSFKRAGDSVTYDSVARKIVSFGGTSEVGFRPPPRTRDTWEFDGAEWTRVANSGPAGRVFHRLAYDSRRGVTVLYGGTDLGSAFYNDTWEWDGIQWTKVEVASPKGPRLFHAMAYDPKRRKVVLFGGSPGVHNGYLNETWEYGLPPLQLTVSKPQPDGSMELRWTGEAPPYQLQSCASLTTGEWRNQGAPMDASSATVQSSGAAKFFRVLSLLGNPH